MTRRISAKVTVRLGEFETGGSRSLTHVFGIMNPQVELRNHRFTFAAGLRNKVPHQTFEPLFGESPALVPLDSAPEPAAREDSTTCKGVSAGSETAAEPEQVKYENTRFGEQTTDRSKERMQVLVRMQVSDPIQGEQNHIEDRIEGEPAHITLHKRKLRLVDPCPLRFLACNREHRLADIYTGHLVAIGCKGNRHSTGSAAELENARVLATDDSPVKRQILGDLPVSIRVKPRVFVHGNTIIPHFQRFSPG